MRYFQNMTNISFCVCSIAVLFLLSGCAAPVLLIGGGAAAAAGGIAIRNERGIMGAIDDSKLHLSVMDAIADKDYRLSQDLDLAVKHGIVVIVGTVRTQKQKDTVVSIVKNLPDVVQLGDEIEIGPRIEAADSANDAAITSRIKASLLTDGNVHSPNFEVTTVKAVVYVCGIAQSAFERAIVLQHCRSTVGVRRVVSYVNIKKPGDRNVKVIRNGRSDEQAQLEDDNNEIDAINTEL